MVVFSYLAPVISGVPQALVLGPLLLVLFINYLDYNVNGIICKFADDTKIAGVMDSEEDCPRLQQHLDQLNDKRNITQSSA